MNPDGTPETKLEQWVLDMGLGRFVLANGIDTALSLAQAEALEESTFEPETNPVHYELLQYILEADDDA